MITVPDFAGKTMKEVGSIATQLGLTHHTREPSGVAYEQYPEAGSIVSKGTILRMSYK